MLIETQELQAPSSPPRVLPAERVTRRGLDACVLLAGALRPSPLVAAAGCSVLDFYLAADSTVLSLWIDRLTELDAAHSDDIPVRVVHGGTTPVPRSPGGAGLLGLRIIQESGPYRGPAGVARDTCEGLDPDATILLADAGRYLATGLEPMLRAHRERGAGVTVACNADRTPAGAYLLQRWTLDLVPRAGFVDLKEQWLRRAVEAGVGVWAHLLPGAGSMPLRTRPQLLAASGHACRDSRSNRVHAGAVIAPGAFVAEGAHVADCIVMPGARVEAGAVVARSIVSAGACVPAGAEVVDTVFVGGRGSSAPRRTAALMGGRP